MAAASKENARSRFHPGGPAACARRHSAGAAPASGIVTLAGLRDQARPLLIFGPKPDDPQLEIQLRILNDHAPGVAERDMTVIALPYRAPSPTPATMTDQDAENARRRFHVAPANFVVLLIGKDGGEKLRSRKPIRWDMLQETIDSMPMRQDEMRRQRQAGGGSR